MDRDDTIKTYIILLLFINNILMKNWCLFALAIFIIIRIVFSSPWPNDKDSFLGYFSVPLGHHNASWEVPPNLQWTQWRSGPGGALETRRWCPSPMDGPYCHHGMIPRAIEH
jgi:hypothetical protein